MAVHSDCWPYPISCLFVQGWCSFVCIRLFLPIFKLLGLRACLTCLPDKSNPYLILYLYYPCFVGILPKDRDSMPGILKSDFFVNMGHICKICEKDGRLFATHFLTNSNHSTVWNLNEYPLAL